MRPRTIVIFELLYIASFALGIFQSWLGWKEMLETASLGFVLFIQISTLAIVGSLVLLVSRRRSKIAMWIIILMTLLGLPLVFGLISSGNLLGSAWITLVQTFAQFIAVTLLFMPSSRKWMASKKVETDLTKTFS